MMSECDVVNLLKKIEYIGIEVWIDGGWGIDALIGKQTRPHNDIDIFIQKKDANAFIEMLISNGYSEIKMEYTTDDHIVLSDNYNRFVDLHLFEFVKDGSLLFNNEIYSSNALNGKGIIGGITVCCLTAEAQLQYHQGYEHKEKDIHDVLLLCKTFGLPVPIEYELLQI